MYYLYHYKNTIELFQIAIIWIDCEKKVSKYGLGRGLIIIATHIVDLTTIAQSTIIDGMKTNKISKLHNLKSDIGYWLNRLRMEVHQSFEQRLVAHDVTIAQWCILIALYNNDAASIKELSLFIETDKASISRVVERLVQKKLVAHTAGKDRRSGRISLTDQGRMLIPNLIFEANKNEQQFFGHLSDQELEQLRSIFTTIFSTIPSIKRKGWLMHNDQMNSLKTLLYTSKSENWRYPKTFQALIELGVTSYEVKIDKYHAEYRGDFGTWIEPVPVGFSDLAINIKFDEGAFVDALKDQMAGKTTYIQWLAKTAQAGVARYVVYMHDRTVTYYGMNAHDFHVEYVPKI